MKAQEAIEILKGMQSPSQDYADMVGAPAWAYGCRYVYPEPEDYAIEEAITALEEKQNRRWIPVSERLPEEQKFYLVTIAKNTGGHDIEYCFYECGKWLMIADGNSEENTCWEEEVKKVVAWMPLPEPYKPE
ncbi:DUF551 domain-containing protein [Hungatella hathewayi]|uniref:DUF551 domain-containing protein n=1 Tax=Hungatella hathewayi TaxID=154046 RepID=A0A3E2WD56_9FIRM|nr:DUF551 domain-containing protein [Hungatella hathewayi]RGC23821.1 DUF551 domain-containing protein [Hungatella hathewayi]